MENINNNTNGNDILETLKKDYSNLKEQFDKQQIINEKLLMKTFSSKVSDINSKASVSVFCGIFVIIMAPFVFHYNPVTNLSWAFVIGTDIMMLICLYFTWKYHRTIKVTADLDIVTFARKIKTFKQFYKDWTKIGFAMIAVWISWMLAELYVKTDNHFHFFLITGLMLFGGIVGMILGLAMNKKIINNCDEIIADIESME